MPDIKPVLDQVNIVVADMSEVVDFYRLLGLDIPDTMHAWMPHHRSIQSTVDGFSAEVDSRGFATRWNAGLPEGWTGVVLGLSVPTRDDVDALYAKATAAGYRGQQPPHDAFWGARYAIVEGPGGALVGLMSPRDATRNGPPPDPAEFAP